MTWQRMFLVLSPVVIFYALYWRYFHFRPEYIKHLQAFLAGLAAALVIILLSPFVLHVMGGDNILIRGFINAAFLEKLAALAVLLMVHRQYPNFSIVEAVLSAMLYALGFSAVENVFYEINYGLSDSIIRIFFSVPMHATTCGIMGYYLGVMRMSSTRIGKTQVMLAGFVLALLMHGLFDTLIFTGRETVYLIVPVLFMMVILNEMYLSRAETVPGYEVIKALNIRFEDWLMMWRQPKYERWIIQSTGRESVMPISLFIWKPGAARIILFAFFIILTGAGLYFRNSLMYMYDLHLSSPDEMLVFFIFPLSMAIFTIIVGAINPEFFKYSEIKIPVITGVVFNRDQRDEETMITYDVTFTGCFLRTFEPFGLGRELRVVFDFPGISRVEITGQIVWERHDVGTSPSGSIIRFIDPPARFYYFIVRHYFFRLRKGIVFFLKLPGFENIRKLFVSPASTMQDDVIVRSGEIIYSAGDPSREFYLLKKGEVEIFMSRENEESIQLNIIEEGSIFGEVSVFTGDRRKDSARARCDCILARADKNNLKALIRGNPDFALGLFQTLSERIQESESVLMNNIKYLESEKIDKQRLLDSLSFFLLIILGNKLDIHGKGIDLLDLKRIVKNVDDRISMELARIILMERRGDESEEDFNARVITDFFKLYGEIYDR